MRARHIIPVAAADSKKPIVVIEVTQTGSRPLDIRLVGSEGEYPYVATSKIVSISGSFQSLTRASSQTATYCKSQEQE
jgi:hypothetical protein